MVSSDRMGHQGKQNGPGPRPTRHMAINYEPGTGTEGPSMQTEREGPEHHGRAQKASATARQRANPTADHSGSTSWLNYSDTVKPAFQASSSPR
jgi:hypothetical protein